MKEKSVLPEKTPQPVAKPAHDLARLLIVTYERVGEKMAGPGIRAWELARALGQHGVRVTLATPFVSTRTAPNVEIVQFHWEEPESIAVLIERVDVVMGFSWVITRINAVLSHPIEKPVIVDVYYAPEIEQIMLNLVRQQTDVDPTAVYVQDMQIYLRQGDFFTCALNSQYDYWVGALMAAGRINQANLRPNANLDHLLAIVSFGIPADPPINPVPRLKGVFPGIEAQDRVLYWGGGIWDWTDPFTFVEALRIINRQRNDVRAVFGALHHFDGDIVPAMDAARRLSAQLEKENWVGNKVFFLDWVAYDQRSDYLLEADLGISLMLPTLENRYAIRSRLLDHLWTGLPGVFSEGDEMAGLLASLGLAHLVKAGDALAVAQAILDCLEQPASDQKNNPALAAARQRFAWPNTVQPLIEFLRNPRLAPDAAAARGQIGELMQLRQDWQALAQHNRELQDELRVLRNSRPVRAADALGNLLHKLGIRL